MNKQEKIGLIMAWVGSCAVIIGIIIYLFVAGINNIKDALDYSDSISNLDDDTKKLANKIVVGVLVTVYIIILIVTVIGPSLMIADRSRFGGSITTIVISGIQIIFSLSILSISLISLLWLALFGVVLAGGIVGLIGSNKRKKEGTTSTPKVEARG